MISAGRLADAGCLVYSFAMQTLVRLGITLGLSAACGCGGAPAKGGKAAGGDGPVRFLAVQGNAVRFYEATPAGIRETRSVTVPSAVALVRWVSADPAVMLAGTSYDDTTTADEKREGEIGRITAKGYEPFPALPAATWTITPPEGRDHFETAEWSMAVSADGAIWQGRCEWGYFGDGDDCTEFVYARLHPAPVTTVREAPKSGEPAYNLPTIVPPPAVQVSLVDVKPPPSEDVPAPEAIKLLRCTQGGKTTEYPPADEGRRLGMDGDITWLSAEPPIFMVDKYEEGLDITTHTMLFEGCEPSPRFEGAHLEHGPNGVFAIVGGEKTWLRWGGRELATLEKVSHLRFAPGR